MKLVTGHLKLGRDKLIKIFIKLVLGVKFDQKISKMRIGKSRRFVKIWVTFLPILSENWLIGIYRKTGPTKSTVLGPGPPPWEKYEIY
jgi:hypothetical protein